MSALLAQLLQENPAETLWIADENSKALLMQGFDFSGDLLTNRWDIAKLAEHHTARAYFNDFRFAELERHYRRIVYPVSKEKAVVHHVINHSASVLGQGAELVLMGGKQSGIKSYATKAAQYFQCNKTLRKHGSDYVCVNTLQARDSLSPPLDDDSYTELRKPPTLGGLYSKPGLFGWNKIDLGSSLLAEQFVDYPPPAGARVIDLGCGYGYLSARLAEDVGCHITATDNNAAALLACKKNFQSLAIEGVVVPSDAGAELQPNIADYLICNPPFHQGFQIEGDLTDRFLQQGARLLKSGGQALYVVNQFIPLERKAQAYFSNVELVRKEKGFCVYRLTNA